MYQILLTVGSLHAARVRNLESRPLNSFQQQFVNDTHLGAPGSNARTGSGCRGTRRNSSA